jgi:hypothetical protein
VSYNISFSYYLSGELSVLPDKVDTVWRLCMERGPEVSLAEYIKDVDGVHVICQFSWYGEGSGRSVDDVLIPHVLPLTRGRAEILLIWESGDQITGLLVDGGKVTECDVAYTLKPKKD